MTDKLRKTSLFEVGEVSNLSEEIDRSRIDFLRGNRDGMLGKDLRETWESLPYIPISIGIKLQTYNPYGEMVEGREAVGGVHSSEEDRDNITLFKRRDSALTDVSKGGRDFK